jgi:phosphoglucosamine mutase
VSLFGTDGIRGKANLGLITPDNIVNLAISVVSYYNERQHVSVNKKFTVVLGKDTRLSCYMLESALMAGLISAGANVILLGPIPTPAIAYLTKSLRADLGVVVSASHNRFEDNGIKFFNSSGSKISTDEEKKISDIFFSTERKKLAGSLGIGKAKRLDDADGRYIEFVKSSFPRNFSLSGKKVVIDTANGAAYKIAPKILWELGAEVITIGNVPDGININEDCGAVAPELLCRTVLENRADIGFALDGDADRVIVVDDRGAIVDGDYILAAIATDWKNVNRLTSNSIVTTSMANLGLEKYINKLGLSLERTDVGDKFVAEKMRQIGANLGGEKSGHIIPCEFALTGDGIVAALQVLVFLIRNNLQASAIKELFSSCPQIIKSIKKDVDLSSTRMKNVINDVKSSILHGNGRVVIRKSGTENVLRVMIESDDSDAVDRAFLRIESAL